MKIAHREHFIDLKIAHREHFDDLKFALREHFIDLKIAHREHFDDLKFALREHFLKNICINKRLSVNSEGYNTHRSLDEFCKKFTSRVGERYLVYTKDLRKDGETTLVPVYMTGLM